MTDRNNDRGTTGLVDSLVELFTQTPTAHSSRDAELQHDMEIALENSLKEQRGGFLGPRTRGAREYPEYTSSVVGIDS